MLVGWFSKVATIRHLLTFSEFVIYYPFIKMLTFYKPVSNCSTGKNMHQAINFSLLSMNDLLTTLKQVVCVTMYSNLCPHPLLPSRSDVSVWPSPAHWKRVKKAKGIEPPWSSHMGDCELHDLHIDAVTRSACSTRLGHRCRRITGVRRAAKTNGAQESPGRTGLHWQTEPAAFYLPHVRPHRTQCGHPSPAPFCILLVSLVTTHVAR